MSQLGAFGHAIWIGMRRTRRDTIPAHVRWARAGIRSRQGKTDSAGITIGGAVTGGGRDTAKFGELASL